MPYFKRKVVRYVGVWPQLAMQILIRPTQEAMS